MAVVSVHLVLAQYGLKETPCPREWGRTVIAVRIAAGGSIGDEKLSGEGEIGKGLNVESRETGRRPGGRGRGRVRRVKSVDVTGSQTALFPPSDV
jgi:hypothetical protein